MLWLAEATPAAAPSPLLYLFAALAAGGLLPLIWQMLQRWRHGANDDAMEVARAAQSQAQSSTELWTRYRVELEDAKEQINQYLRELVAVNRELGAATGRLAKLEEDLRAARNDSASLRDQLAEARARRDELQSRVRDLQDRIRVLERPDRRLNP